MKYSTKDIIDKIIENANFTDRQYYIFRLKYIKGHDIGYIADDVGLSKPSISNELYIIRNKIDKVLENIKKN